MESRGSLGRYAVRVVIRRVIYIVIAAIIAALAAAFIAPPAHATPAPGQVRAPSPGAAYRWGVPAAWLTRTDCGADSTAYNAWVQTLGQAANGGWQYGGGALIDVGAGTAGNSAGSIRTPSYSMMLEPVVADCAGAAARGRWMTPRIYGAMNDPRSGSVVARTLISYNNSDRAWVCQATEWALPANQWKYNGSAGGDFAPSMNSRTVSASLWGPPVTNTPTPLNNKCPYLVSITLNLTTYTGPNSIGIDGNPNPGVTVNSAIIWSADTWYGATSVNYYAPVDPEQQVCRVGGVAVSDQCPFVLGSAGGVDGTDPNQVCGNAPTPIWLDLGWLNKWIFYMAQCLFRPANGFDRGQWVSTAWSQGAGGTISASLNSVSHAFSIAESCGVILNTGGSGPIPNFSINTCSWSAWSSVKTVIGIGVSALFAFWLIRFLLGTIIGVVNRRTTNPIAGDDE